MSLNPFHGTGLLQCALKTSGNLWFSNVFQEVQKSINAMKWVEDIFNKYVSVDCLLHNRACFLRVDLHWILNQLESSTNCCSIGILQFKVAVLTYVHLIGFLNSLVISGQIQQFSRFYSQHSNLYQSVNLFVYSSLVSLWQAGQARGIVNGGPGCHQPPTHPTSISELNKVQKFQFQISGILLFLGVQKLYGPEIS